MKKHFISALILSSSLYAQTQTYDLDQLIGLSIQNNPSLSVQKARSVQSKAFSSRTTSQYLPQLNVSADAGQNGGKTPDIQGGADYDDSIVSGEVQAQQLIYDFGKTGGAIDSAQFKESAQKFNEDAILSSTVNDVYQNYYNVLEKKHLIAVQEESLKLQEFQYYEATEYLKAGVKTKIDVTNAQVSVSTAKLALIQARFDYKRSRVSLENTLGFQPNYGDYLLYDKDNDIKTMMDSIENATANLEVLHKKAKQDRPELNANKELISASNEDVISAKGDYFPRLDAVGTYNKYFEHSEFQAEEQYTAVVRLQWNLFSGLDTQSQVQEQRGAKLENEATLALNNLNVRQEVTNAYLESQEYIESLQVNFDTVNFATDNLEQAREQYKQGINTYLEYNDAQVKYISAKTDFLVAYFNYKKSLAQLKFTTGDFALEYQ